MTNWCRAAEGDDVSNDKLDRLIEKVLLRLDGVLFPAAVLAVLAVLVLSIVGVVWKVIP